MNNTKKQWIWKRNKQAAK